MSSFPGLTPLLLAVLLASPASAGEPETKPRQADPVTALDADPESLPTPPGSKEDQALWAGALEASYRHVAERGAGRQLLWRAVAGRFDEFLAKLAAGTGEDARRAADLRKRLTEEYAEVYRAITTVWGVDARLGCRAEAVDLDGAMRAAAGGQGYELAEARKRAAGCTERARHGAHETHEANQALRAVLDAAEAFLVPRLAAPGATATPAPAPGR